MTRVPTLGPHEMVYALPSTRRTGIHREPTVGPHGTVNALPILKQLIALQGLVAFVTLLKNRNGSLRRYGRLPNFAITSTTERRRKNVAREAFAGKHSSDERGGSGLNHGVLVDAENCGFIGHAKKLEALEKYFS